MDDFEFMGDFEIIRKTLDFLSHKNIENIDSVFLNNVDVEMIKHLNRIASEYKQNTDDNLKALLKFINHLDYNNRKILVNYIINNY